MTSTTTARPPRTWELQTVALLSTAVVAIALTTVYLVFAVLLRSYVVSGGVTDAPALLYYIADHAALLDAVNALLMLGYLFGFALWRRGTREMVTMVGGDARRATQHWTAISYVLLIALSFVVGVFTYRGFVTENPNASAFTWWAVQIGVRLVAVVLLLAAVRVIQRRVRQVVADAGVTLRVGDIAPRRVSAVPGASGTGAGGPGAGGPGGAVVFGPADDEFWRRAGRLATAQRADIAVLETLEDSARRWALIPETGDTAAVRAALPENAVVMVFADPPADITTKGYVPPKADEYLGLLEDARSGALTFHSVTPQQTRAFLGKAGKAKRWALYPVGTPAVLTAVARKG